MLLGCLFTIALIFGHGFGADHNTFLDCGRVGFCSNFRGRGPEDRYSVDPGTVAVDNGAATVTFDLRANDQSGDLKLTIYSLAGNTLRLKINEPDSTRYQLQDVLDGEPQIQELGQVDTSGDSTVIITESGSNAITVRFAPFSIEFRKNDVLELVLNGNRLIMEHTDSSKAFAFGVSFPSAQQLYGIHEHAEHIGLQNTPGVMDPYRLRNLDVAYYELGSPMAVYGAVPVLYGHGQAATSGFFLHNAAQHWYDISNGDGGSETYVMVESGTLDLFVFLGPSPADVVRQYVKLTGTAHLPQLWTLGYHQSRYSYMSQDEVRDVITNFDNSNFQMDAIWLDIDYTDGKKYFTWNPSTYSDPIGMQQFIMSTNRHLITIIDPHIKVEAGYSVYDGALAQDLFVKNADGSNFQGECWPGTSSYMDFLNPQARDYYASMYSFENFPQSTATIGGIWNDMNEPSVFQNDIEMTLPGDSLHAGGVVHRDIHNIYGFLHTISTHQGLMQRDNGEKRPFVLTRSHFAGSQRYAAIWTGDNQADWGYLAISYTQCLTSNLVGIVFCGADVGGFFNNPSDELFERWYQAGAWLPFYRAHSAIDSNRREPYLFSEDVQQVVRNAIQTRYKHLPVWYTLFFEHTRNGDPIIRPLFYQYPSDTNAFRIDNQLLVGRDILVRAVTEPGVGSVQVYFPGGDGEMWISLTDSSVHNGNGFVDVPVDIQSIPVYYRRGSVIARKDTVRPNSQDMLIDGHTLYVTLNSDNTAHGTIYIDDNLSFDYKNNARYNYLSLDFSGTDLTMTKIDDFANDGGYDFIIDQIIFNAVLTPPRNGKPGTYKKIVHDRDATGRLLKNLKFDFTKSVTLKLVEN